MLIQVGYGTRTVGTSCIRLWTGALATQLLRDKFSDHPHQNGKIMKRTALSNALAECDAYLLIDRNPFSSLEAEERPTHENVTELKIKLEALLERGQPYYETQP